MKKLVLLGVTVLGITSLAACSSNSSKTTNSKSTEKSSSVAVKKVDNSKFDTIVNELKKDFDKDNEGLITTKIENDVIDSDFPKGHTIIKVMTTNKSTDNIKNMLDAINGNTATDSQKLGIQAIRQEVSDVAKKLPDNTTEINFGYAIDSDNTQLVAASTKVKDIIPIVVN